MNENVNAGPYSEVFRKIGYYRANSNDLSYHAFLDEKLRQAEKGLVTPADLIRELDESYAKYQAVARSLSGDTNSTPDFVSSLNEEKSKSRAEVEYKIGAGLLSVIGSVFILVALVYFGKHFLNDVFQGILIYAVGLVLILVSQIFLEKKLSKFSHVVTGIGFAVLYFATIFSCIYLKMFNLWIALLILAFISVINVILARVRKSQIMEIISSCGAVSSIYAVYYGKATLEQFFLIGGLILFVNLLLFVVPYKKGYAVSKIVRLCVLFAAVLYFKLPYGFRSIDPVYILGFMLLGILVMFVCFAFNTEDSVVKCISLVFIGILAVAAIPENVKLNLEALVYVAGLFVVCLISFLIMIKKKEKWAAYSTFVIATMLMALSAYKVNINLTLLIVVGLLLLSKLLFAVNELTYIDAIITTLAMVAAVINYANPISYVILAIALIGAIMCMNIKLYHEFLLLFGGIAFAMLATSESAVKFCTIPMIMLVILVLLLICNLIPTMQVKGILAYNIISVSISGLFVLALPLAPPKGIDNIICLSAVLVIGMITILVCFTKKFFMDTNARYIILAVFLTYVAYFVDVDDLWISVSLMIVSFILIAVGCIANRFEIRIYGLVLALLVCVKVAFYDFKNENEFNRMIVFFVVGVLAIAISFAYLVLEKKEQKELKERQMAVNAPLMPETSAQTETSVNDTVTETVDNTSEENGEDA